MPAQSARKEASALSARQRSRARVLRLPKNRMSGLAGMSAADTLTSATGSRGIAWISLRRAVLSRGRGRAAQAVTPTATVGQRVSATRATVRIRITAESHCTIRAASRTRDLAGFARSRPMPARYDLPNRISDLYRPFSEIIGRRRTTDYLMTSSFAAEPDNFRVACD